MGAVKVSDVGSLFPGMAGMSDQKVSAGAAGDFAKLINDAAAKAAPTAGVNSAEAVKEAPKSTRPVQKADSSEASRIQHDNDQNDRNKAGFESDSVDRKELKARIDEKIDTIDDAIKDELGVTDEDIEEAMAGMGLVPMDLLNADDLKGLMLELAGETDPLALITNESLLASINDVTALVTEMVNELQEEFGIGLDELNIMFGMDNTGEAIPEGSVPAAEEDFGSLEEDKGVRVEITRRDDTGRASDVNNASAKPISEDRREVRNADEEDQEGHMQNAMAGQSSPADKVEAGNVFRAAEDIPTAYTDAEDILSQVTDRIKVDIGEDQTSMELQLHPASLGTVNLQINSNGGVVSAHIVVQNEAVRSALEGQLVQLLQTFEEQGQKVEAIEVSVAGYDLDRSQSRGSDSDSSERQERRTDGVGRTTRRRLNLNELNEEDLEDLTEEEQLAAEMMTANGGSVDYLA